MTRTIALSATTVALAAAVLTGCSSAHHDAHGSHSAGTSTQAAAGGAAARGPHNDADTDFAGDMIPHHRQAVEMADMALSTSDDPQVLALARTIKAAQAPEIATMTGWLQGWDAPVPSGSTGHGMGEMDHSDMSMPGMMSAADMSRLSRATGATFDRLWLTMMITHHRGALSMARTELAEGANSDARTLARTIISSQSGEISRMTALLKTK